MEKKIEATASEDERFCFDILFNISRIFYATIDKLKDPLRKTVCVFYLVLRALDTIEDDTSIEKLTRLEALNNFSTCLGHFNSNGPIGAGQGLLKRNKYYKELTEKFDIVLRVFGKCKMEDQKIIRDTVSEMAQGMIKYLTHPIETMADYNEYCYYVAGTVGIGLNKLFQSNLILENVHDDNIETLANSSNIFLQKTNILRDIHEDLTQSEESVFLPRDVWEKYVRKVHDLLDESHLPQAIDCLNFLINDAFQHLPDTIEYLSLLSQTTVFRAYAAIEVFSVGVFEKMFNNPAVFSSKVMLEETECTHIFESIKDMKSFLGKVQFYLSNLSRKAVAYNSSKQNGSSNSYGTKNWILESLEFDKKYDVK